MVLEFRLIVWICERFRVLKVLGRLSGLLESELFWSVFESL